MPTYQYACKNADCGNEFERVQSFSDPAITECPICSGPVRKVFGAVGVVFKGSGFYRTDSRASSTNGSDKPAAKTPAAPKTDGAGTTTDSGKSSTSGSGSGSGSAGKAAASA
jgi:putative FmdB family regulatory protein